MKRSIILIISLCSFFFIQTNQTKQYTADVIIFSYDRPLQLYAMLESLYKYTTDINSVAVIYRTSNDHFAQAFNAVALDFPDVIFLHQQSMDDFKTLTVQ